MNKLSIITITFNNYNDLIETIKLLELIKYHELIVINGGQCQNTRDYLKRNDIKHLSESDQGISDAFNKGIKLSTGKYIIFINSGDRVIKSDYINRAIEYLEEHKNIVFTHGDIIFEDNLCGPIHMKPSRSAIGRGMPSWHPTMIYRKSVFDKIGHFDLDYKISMDYEFLCRINKHRFKWKYIESNPFILMDGTGYSVLNEHTAINECYTALKKNKLLFKNIFPFFRRLTFYYIRVILKWLNLNKLTIFFKKIKYPQNG